MHGTYCKFEQGWFAYLYGHAITKQRPFSHAPRACGVLPCIKPTVKTVGASTHTCSPRNAAEWRCGLAPRHAPLRGMLPPIIPYHSAGVCQHQRREKWQAGFWLPFFKLLRRFVTFSQFPALSYTQAPRISLPISGEKKRAAGGEPVARLAVVQALLLAWALRSRAACPALLICLLVRHTLHMHGKYSSASTSAMPSQ